VVGQNTSNSAFLGSCVGVSIGSLLVLLPGLRRLLAPVAIVVIVAMPFSVPTLHSLAYCSTITAAPSIAHRLAIWETVRQLIPDHPLFGWGVDSARVAPGGKDEVELRACDANGAPTGKVEVRGEALPLHPHNGAMDIWFSLGAVGIVAVCWAIWRAFSAAHGHCPGRLGAATLGATSSIIFVSALLGYGLWQGWFAAALCLSVASLALLMCPKPEDRP
jgi:O-antigen ligase